MPNWCHNKLLVIGSQAKLQEFKQFAQGLTLSQFSVDTRDDDIDILDFNKFVPYPEKFAKADFRRRQGLTDKDGYNNGGYDWCIRNWGTKWGACDVDLSEHSKRSLLYYFNTAWSPPAPVVVEMSEKFPTLMFHLNYAEAGCAFQGNFWAKGGEIVKDESKAYRGSRGG